MAAKQIKHHPMNMRPRGASLETLVRRIRYGGRKGRSAARRLWPWAPVDTWTDVATTLPGSGLPEGDDNAG